jgi:ricin-type beta-trefoil lectin protein
MRCAVPRSMVSSVVSFVLVAAAVALLPPVVLRITPRHSGKAVEVAGCSTADGATLRQWTWQNTNCQKFRRA